MSYMQQSHQMFLVSEEVCHQKVKFDVQMSPWKGERVWDPYLIMMYLIVMRYIMHAEQPTSSRRQFLQSRKVSGRVTQSPCAPLSGCWCLSPEDGSLRSSILTTLGHHEWIQPLRGLLHISPAPAAAISWALITQPGLGAVWLEKSEHPCNTRKRG